MVELPVGFRPFGVPDHLQRATMVNAKSLSGRIFSSAEHAENHCQMGNLGLALRVMADWLDGAPTEPGASS